MKEIILIGGGGHCKSCVDVIELGSEYKIYGIVDNYKINSDSVLGYSVIGTDNDIGYLVGKCKNFLITIGSIYNFEIRKNLYRKVIDAGGRFPVIVSPRAYVSTRSFVGNGTIIMHDAVVNAGVSVGSNCIVNTKSLLEHDVVVGDNCHVSTGAIVNGNCVVHDDVFIGSGAVIKESTVVERGCFVKSNILLK